MDEQIHIIPDADEILDYAGWEMDNRPITLYIAFK